MGLIVGYWTFRITKIILRCVGIKERRVTSSLNNLEIKTYIIIIRDYIITYDTTSNKERDEVEH